MAVFKFYEHVQIKLKNKIVFNKLIPKKRSVIVDVEEPKFL